MACARRSRCRDSGLGQIGRGVEGKDAVGLLAIARGGVAGGRVDLDVLSDLAHLLERSDQDLLGEFLNTAEREGIPREKLGYPAAAAALRDGDAEAAKLLLLA